MSHEECASAPSDHMPAVSVIVPFLNASRFFQEAIDSVFAQTYSDWELLLIDDGSTDDSTLIAKQFAAAYPDKVRALEHPNHENRGASASRNLGITNARGKYIAFLDADDVWFPQKLVEQLAILEAHPTAAMVYGATEWWYSWDESSGANTRDHQQAICVPPESLLQPPEILHGYLSQAIPVPCPCGVLVRRETIDRVGAFEAEFKTLYDDQVFYTKVTLRSPIFVSGKCWERYRQHAGSLCSQAERTGEGTEARDRYLRWVKQYFVEQRVEDTRLLRTLAIEVKLSKQQRHPFIVRKLREKLGRVVQSLPSKIRIAQEVYKLGITVVDSETEHGALLNGTRDRIPSEEIEFHPHSFATNSMRLFEWRGELYRGIGGESAVFFRELFRKGMIAELQTKGLIIESEPLSLVMNGFDLVVRHRKLRFTSYPNEWCAAMLQEAALLLIDLGIALAQKGYTLIDGHPWNVVYEGCRPVFVDLGSIQQIDSSTWAAYAEFCRYCLYPLALMTAGETEIARLLMWEDRGVLARDVKRLTNLADSVFLQRTWRTSAERLLLALDRRGRRFGSRFHGEKRRIKKGAQIRREQKSHLAFMEQIKTHVRKLESLIPREVPFTATAATDDDVEERKRVVSEIFDRFRPDSLFDASCGDGAFAILAARAGINVVAVESDERRVTQLYHQARAFNLSILPLVLDFAKPTSARGLGNHWSVAAADRLKCEGVLALNFVHRLIAARHLNFEHISEGLALFSTRWAIVDFVPHDDPELIGTSAATSSDYTLEHFIRSLKQHFREVNEQAFFPCNRTLLICEK
ncbi:MAG: glycosyltransferase family 2 protein [Verrucomicrobiota bacterium]|nr:glycosyltransferase family 2 protein [Verrucomicrobiota bacterium]